MSIEFVDPAEPHDAAATPDPAKPRTSALPGRLVALAAVLGAVLVVVAVTMPLYAVRRTAFIVDFDRTTTQTTDLPVDAFGDASPVQVGPVGQVALVPAGQGAGAFSSTFTVSTPDGVAYGRWWLGLAVALLAAGVWALVRPRSSGPAAVVAALGGVLLGSVGTAWLQIRAVTDTSVPQIRFAARPDAGLWLVVAGGAVALAAGLLRALPTPHRRRRRVDRAEPSVAVAPG